MIVELIARVFLVVMGNAGAATDPLREWCAPPAVVGERAVTCYAQTLIRNGRVVNNEGQFAVYTVREVLPHHLRVEAEGVEGLSGWVRRDRMLAFDKAVDFYTAVIDQGLDDRARAWRGLIHQQRGELAEALADFDAMLALDPADTWTIQMRIETLARQGDRNGATRALETLIRLEPGNVDHLFARAKLRWLAGDYAGVVADANAILALRLNDGWALAYRGGARVELREFEPALVDLDAALRTHPDNIFALSKRVEVRLNLKDAENAVADAMRCVQLDPDQFWCRYTLGSSLELRGDHDGAARAFGEAIRLDPTSAPARAKRAACRVELGDLDGAWADSDEAVRLDPKSSYAIAERGYVALRQGRNAEAIVDFDRSLDLDPSDANTFANRGYAHQRRGDLAPARDDFRRSAELSPDDPDVLVQLAWLLAAAPEAAVRDGEAAVKAATHACELTKWSRPDALGALAAAHAELEDYDRATRRTREALAALGGGDEGRAFYEHLLDLFEVQQPYRTVPGVP